MMEKLPQHPQYNSDKYSAHRARYQKARGALCCLLLEPAAALRCMTSHASPFALSPAPRRILSRTTPRPRCCCSNPRIVRRSFRPL